MKNCKIIPELQRLIELSEVSMNRPKLLREPLQKPPKIDLNKLESFNGQ